MGSPFSQRLIFGAWYVSGLVSVPWFYIEAVSTSRVSTFGFPVLCSRVCVDARVCTQPWAAGSS